MTKPPRIWVPRQVFVAEDGELIVGSSVGQFVEVQGIPRGTLGRRQRLLDARHTLWMVERAALDETLIRDYALVLPERLIDAEVQPNAHRWLSELPLVCISGIKAERIIPEDRLRLFRVAVEESGKALVLSVDVRGGGKASTSLSLDLSAVAQKVTPTGGDELRRRARGPSSLVDRVLRQATNGALDEDSVVAAWQAVTLIEPGYGYRGALDGTPATIEQVQFGARALEAVFSQINERADAMLPDAQAIRSALARPRSEDDSRLQLPPYGEVDCVVEEPVTLRLDAFHGTYTTAGRTVDELALPSIFRYFVTEFEPWQPTIPPGLARELASVLRERKPPPTWVALLAVALLLAIAAVSFALRR